MSDDRPATDSSNAARSMPWNRWLHAVILLVSVSIAMALVIPAIQQAREAARRTQTSNNLKQIGLSLFNYHDVYRTFPPGGTLDESGRGHHGWMYSIMPFVDQNTFAHDVDHRVPWDFNFNRHRYRLSLSCYRVPGVEEVVTTDGFPVTHFAANPAVMFRNSSMRIRDFKKGMSNSWLAGVAGGNYQPWGYPFNWRKITGPLNESTSSFGRPRDDGTFFLLGDATVRFYSDKLVGGEQMPAGMFDHPPLPEASFTTKPSRKFDLTDSSGLPRQSIQYLEPDRDLGSLAAETVVLADGSIDFLQIRGSYKTGFDPPTIDHLKKALSYYPNARNVLLPIPLDDQVAELLATLPELTHVYAKSVAVSGDGAKLLSGIRSLEVLLVEDLSDESAEHFADLKPRFEIRRGRVR